MGEVVFHYEDRKRNYLTESSLNLAAICSEDAFHFLITGQDNVPVLAGGIHFSRDAPFYHEPLAYLPRVMSSQEVLFSDFTTTTIAVRGLPFTVVPAHAFVPDTARDILSEVTEVSASDSVRYEPVSTLNMVLITAYPASLTDEIGQYFEHAQLRHVLTCLLRSTAPSDATVHMELALAARTFEVAVSKNQTLLFANAFPSQAESDVLYYICAVIEDLQLDPASLTIRMGGAGWTRALQQYLKMHLPDVRFVEFDQVHEAQILNLVSVSQCAS